VKWKDHKRITFKVCEHFGLDNAHEIADASLLPDTDPDYVWDYSKKRIYKRRIPHHEKEAIKMAFNHLKRARKNLLSGKSFVEALGRALHYLQDYSVDPKDNLWIFKYRSDEAHKEREGDLDKFDVDIKAIEEAKNQEIYPHEFTKHVFKIKRGKNPEEIMKISSYLCSLALTLVMNPKKPEKLDNFYRRALITHIALLLFPWFLLIINFKFAILSAIASYLLHHLDFNYSKWKIDYEWFKVR